MGFKSVIMFLNFVLIVTAHGQQQPVMRNNASITFDKQRGEVIMYGGSIHSQNVVKMRDSVVWSWDGNRWKVITTAPSLRADAIFQADPDSKTILLHGGRFSYAPRVTKEYNDTWEFDGKDWYQKNNGSPPLLAHAAAAYDVEKKMIVLFGGHATKINKIVNDTWSYQNGVWKLMTIPNSPPNRCLHGMFYDANRKGVVVIGGMNENGPLNDMWILENMGWRLLSKELPFMAIGPYSTVALGEPGDYLAFISEHSQPESQTWMWNNNQWKKLDIPNPSPRTSASMTFDSKRNCVVLYGGERGVDSLSELWEFSVNEKSWSQKTK